MRPRARPGRAVGGAREVVEVGPRTTEEVNRFTAPMGTKVGRWAKAGATTGGLLAISPRELYEKCVRVERIDVRTAAG